MKKELSIPKPSRVVNKKGLIYKPTKAPSGLCGCQVMLELKPTNEDYIFPSRIRAGHARHHTIKYLVNNSLPVDYDDFIIQVVES